MCAYLYNDFVNTDKCYEFVTRRKKLLFEFINYYDNLKSKFKKQCKKYEIDFGESPKECLIIK